MTRLPRSLLRALLAVFSRHPKLKRRLVDVVYRMPWIDARLRTLTQRAVHPEAMLDLDITRMPEGSRRSLARIRARMPR